VLAGAEAAGIFESRDGGASWSRLTTLDGQPGRADWDNPANQPPGHLGISSINLLLLIVSAAPFWYAARLAHLHERPGVIGRWLLVGVAFGIVAIVLRGFEFKALHTRWDSNAYGSISWSILAVHLTHLIAGTIETLLIALVMFIGPVERKHYTDASVMAVYWYFIVVSWVALYGIVFLAPRFM